MEALVVEQLHTPSIKPHGEKSQESGFFSVLDLADVKILITTASFPQIPKTRNWDSSHMQHCFRKTQFSRPWRGRFSRSNS
jgi:hypothetical protein